MKQANRFKQVVSSTPLASAICYSLFARISMQTEILQ